MSAAALNALMCNGVAVEADIEAGSVDFDRGLFDLQISVRGSPAPGFQAMISEMAGDNAILSICGDSSNDWLELIPRELAIKIDEYVEGRRRCCINGRVLSIKASQAGSMHYSGNVVIEDLFDRTDLDYMIRHTVRNHCKRAQKCVKGPIDRVRARRAGRRLIERRRLRPQRQFRAEYRSFIETALKERAATEALGYIRQ